MSRMSEKQWLYNGEEHPSYSELQAENAELRKLVALWVAEYSDCPDTGCCQFFLKIVEPKLAELGIEV